MAEIKAFGMFIQYALNKLWSGYAFAAGIEPNIAPGDSGPKKVKSENNTYEKSALMWRQKGRIWE